MSDRQKNHRVHQQHPDEHRSRRGRDEAVAVAVVENPLTWSSMKSNASSTNAWRLFGTPEVAPRTTHQMKPMPTTPTSSAVTSESTCSVQKPPSQPAW